MEKQTILDALDPELIERVASRREMLRKAGRVGVGLAVASVPVAFGGLARQAFGQALPQDIIDVLNFALTLEYLEDEFYRTGLNTSGLIPDDTRDVFQIISEHEASHVALLKSVIPDADEAPKPTFDFTAGGKFNPFGDYAQFLILSQGFEDLGVRAYKGQAPNLISNDQILTTALQIHSVEARHAAEVRRLRGQEGWIPFDNTDAMPIEPVYAGEANTTHLMLDVTTVTEVGEEEVTESFDEPMSREDVLAIASMFIQS